MRLGMRFSALICLTFTSATAVAQTGSGSAIPQPTGQGSIRGLGESHNAALTSGGVKYTLPIASAPGRAGVTPALAVSYSSGAGNGVAGFGWDLSAPFIGRQLERGVPRYADAPLWTPDEDRLVYSDGGELVPVSSTTAFEFDGVPVPPGLDTWQQYRPQVLGDPVRVFRAPDWTRWIVQSSSGTWLEFGLLPSSAAPAEAVTASVNAVQSGPSGELARWYLSRSCDAHGSCIYYQYSQDQRAVYLTDVFHLSPAACASDTPEATRDCTLPFSQYGARTHLVYEPRNDAFRSYATGFEVRTARRLRRAEVTAVPQGQSTGRMLVRRYHYGYSTTSFHSLLTSAQLEGRPDSEDATRGARVANLSVAESSLGDALIGATLPAMRFDYTAWSAEVGGAAKPPQVVTSPSSPSVSISNGTVAFFDANSDGLPDVIDTNAIAYQAGGNPAVGVFFNGFGGSGTQPTTAGAFSTAAPIPIPTGTPTSSITLTNSSTKLSDVTGDGLGELLHLPRQSSYTYFHVGRDPLQTSPSPCSRV